MSSELRRTAHELMRKYSGGDGGLCVCGTERKHYKDHCNQQEYRCQRCRMDQVFVLGPRDPKVVKLAEAYLKISQEQGLF